MWKIHISLLIIFEYFLKVLEYFANNTYINIYNLYNPRAIKLQQLELIISNEIIYN